MTAITTYGTLKTAIAGKMNRTDLTAEMPGFVTNAEAAMNIDVKHPLGETKTDPFAIAAEYTNLPADYLEMIGLQASYGGNSYDFEFDGVVGALKRRGNIVGFPIKGFTIVGSQVRASPPPSSSVAAVIHYRTKLTTITGTEGGTNWLLTLAPDLYLYRSAMEAAVHMQDAKRLEAYGLAYQGALSRVNKAGKNYRSAVGMRVRLG